MAQRIDKDSLKLDQPRRTPGHPTKSHVVKTKIDGKEKILRFGEQGAKTAGKPKAGESQAMKDKRARFKSRHAKNIAKGKSSPAYWADKVKWADGGSVSKGSVDKDKLKEAYGQAAASMKEAGITGIGGGAKPSDKPGGMTISTMASDLGNMVELDRTVFDDDDDYVDPISPEMRLHLSSPPGAYPEPMGPVSPPSVIKTTFLNDNVAPLSQPSQPMGFLETLREFPFALGRDLKMGWQAGMFRGRDTQRENLMEAGYTPAEINDYFARTDATLARNAAEAQLGLRDRDDVVTPNTYADLARAFAQEYNIVGRNRTQLMPLLETFLRSRGILDPGTYSENIFNTLSVPMQEGGSVDLARLARRYADGGAVDEDEPSFFSLSGQERRRALDALNERIGEGVRYYLGPTPIPQLLGLAAEMTPSRTVERASDASRRMARPGLTPLQRATAGAEMLGDVATIVAPIAMGARGAMPMAEAAQEAFMGLSVPARAAAQDVVDRLNQPGPMPRTLYSNPLMRAEEEAAGIRAYHGSPHTFERFDMSKIGTGEGAQAYGRGLYFAEKEGVARGYRDALSARDSGVQITSRTAKEEKVEKALRKYLEDAGWDDITGLRSAIRSHAYQMDDPDMEDVFETMVDRGQIKVLGPLNPGRLYEVNIAARPEDFIDYDKPLSEQSDLVKKYFGYVPKPTAEEERAAIEAMLGIGDPASRPVDIEDMYRRESAANEAERRFQRQVQGGGIDEAARIALSEAGVPGIRYLDAGSRRDGDGTRNYVVFDDRLISIVRMYGIAGAAALLGVSVADVEQAMAEGMAAEGMDKAEGGVVRFDRGGSVDLERLLERYGPRGADASRDRPIEQDGMVYDEWADRFITPEQRLSQLREFQREMPRDYEDYLAAGFRQPELTAANITRPLPSYRARNYMTPEQAAESGFGTLEASEPTLREKHTYALEEGLQKLGASRSLARQLAEGALGNPDSTKDLGIGLADFTPLSLIYGGQEGARTFERGINAGDPLTAGLGAAEVGLSALEAFPLTAAGGRALKRALPTAEDALNRMLDSYDPNVLGSNLGNIGGGRRPPTLITPEERQVIAKGGSRGNLMAIRDQVSAQKMSYPADQGWAQDVMRVRKVTPKKGNFEVKYKEVPYNFEKPPENMSPDEWQRTMVGRQVDEIRKLAQRAKDGDPAAMDIIKQANWYRSMRSSLRSEFGGMGDVFADILGATSAQTGVEMNWRNAVEIMRRFSRGEYDDEIRMYQEMLDSGDVNPTRLQKLHKDANNPFKLITNSAGALFNTNSPAATKALFDMFRTAKGAPKTPNFTGNLIGYTNAATVDVWDARHLRRLAGLPRLPPPVEKGVTGSHLKGSTLEQPKIGGEFGFGQKVKRDAARIINDEGILREVAPDLADMNPDDLQAVAWFLEKELWTKNGWTNKAGEGGSFEYEASLAGAASPENVTALRRELNQSFKPPAPRKRETEDQYAQRVAEAKSVFDARQIEAMNELDAMKAPLARYVLGISVERPGMRPSNLRQAEVAERLGEPAKVDPSVVMYQINNTYGRFMKADERSFNAEFVTRKGFDPSAVTRRMVEIAKESNQDSAFISRVLPQRTENSRPGVEIYFRKRQGPDFARKLSDKLSDYGVDGFTYVTDNRVMDRPKAQAGASEEAVAGINGLRFQYIPEFDMGRDAWAAMSPAERAAKIDEIERKFRQIVRDISETEPVVSGANLMHYETNLFERGDYDGLLGTSTSRRD